MKPWLQHNRELSFQLWTFLLFLRELLFLKKDLLIELLIVVERVKYFTKNLLSWHCNIWKI